MSAAMSATMSAPSLYERLLGCAFAGLPEPLRAFHGADGPRIWHGRACVEGGSGRLARLAARLFGLPPAGADVPVTVRVERDEAGEVWRRDFGGRVFASAQCAGRGRWAGLLCERVGPVSVGMALEPGPDGLRLGIRRWRLLGLPLPRALAPGGPVCEWGADGRFHFDVAIDHPLTGRIVRYRGWLEDGAP